MASDTRRSGFQTGSKAALFLELAQPDSLGFSRSVPVSEFTGQYARLQFGNGGDWIRKDGSLAKRFNIRRHPEGTGRITHVELQGFRKVVDTETDPGENEAGNLTATLRGTGNRLGPV